MMRASYHGCYVQMENAMFKRILVPTDGTTPSNRAVEAAAALAERLGATLTIFHAKRTWKESSTDADTLLARASALAKKQGAKTTTSLGSSDSPAEAIIAAARSAKADLIVMASHRRKGLDKLLMGSELKKVVAGAKLPVLVMR